MLGGKRRVELLSKALRRIEDLQHAQLAATQDLAQRLDRLEAGYRAERQYGAQGLRVPPATATAIRLAAAGAGVDDLIGQCGLRASEAELLRDLYGRVTDRAAGTENVTQVA